MLTKFRSINSSDTFKLVNDTNGCTTIIHNFDPLVHKPRYTVGIYSSESDEVVYRMYNVTYAQYLTATAGRRFDPPIEFDIVPVNLDTLSKKALKEEVDFFFSSSAVFSCMASEQGAQALTTIINRREARGHVYDLDMYGGVIFTLATNNRVNTLADLKGVTIGAGGITVSKVYQSEDPRGIPTNPYSCSIRRYLQMMGGGQTQFYEMFRAGLSYVADPLQMMFTTDESKTVQGVLDGDFEVGMARTDQIERHADDNGELINPGELDESCCQVLRSTNLTSPPVFLDADIFKVINPQIHVMQDGQLFPFMSSTGLHPVSPGAERYHAICRAHLSSVKPSPRMIGMAHSRGKYHIPEQNTFRHYSTPSCLCLDSLLPARSRQSRGIA